MAGLQVEAVEGSAILWKNLFLDSGKPDPTTLHAGCPVALGSKWITNKWIQMFDQFKSYPCPLTLGDLKKPSDINILQKWRKLNEFSVEHK